LMKLVPNQPTELLQMFPIHSLFDFYRQFTEDLKITNQALGNHLEFYLYPKATITVWKKYCSIWFTKFYWVVITSEGRVGLKTQAGCKLQYCVKTLNAQPHKSVIRLTVLQRIEILKP
jgi:hypothetical protein